MTTATVETTALRMTSVLKDLRAPLFRYLFNRVRGARLQTAEDLLQETMLHAWRSIAKMPEPAEERRRWLFTIARNVANDADRARRRRPEEFGGYNLDLLQEDRSGPERVAVVHAVRAAVATLPPIHRDVIVDLYYRDRTPAEVADRLQVPLGTIKSRAHYALRTLRCTLE